MRLVIVILQASPRSAWLQPKPRSRRGGWLWPLPNLPEAGGFLSSTLLAHQGGEGEGGSKPASVLKLRPNAHGNALLLSSRRRWLPGLSSSLHRSFSLLSSFAYLSLSSTSTLDWFQRHACSPPPYPRAIPAAAGAYRPRLQSQGSSALPAARGRTRHQLRTAQSTSLSCRPLRPGHGMGSCEFWLGSRFAALRNGGRSGRADFRAVLLHHRTTSPSLAT